MRKASQRDTGQVRAWTSVAGNEEENEDEAIQRIKKGQYNANNEQKYKSESTLLSSFTAHQQQSRSREWTELWRFLTKKEAAIHC